jgi:hypothetical protein
MSKMPSSTLTISTTKLTHNPIFEKVAEWRKGSCHEEKAVVLEISLAANCESETRKESTPPCRKMVLVMILMKPDI